MAVQQNVGRTTLSLGGGTYGLIGIGVGLAASSWGTSIILAIFSGLFWPVTVSYWLVRMLHKLAS